MLPDWPELKDICLKAQMRLVHERLRKVNPLLGMIRRKIQHEGHDMTYETEQGQICKVEYKQVAAKTELPNSQVPTSTFKEAVERMEPVADNIGAQMGRMFFQKVDEVTAAAGTAVDAGGKGFTFDLYCEMLEKIELGFDAAANPIMPTMCASPEALEKASAVLVEALKDLANQKRLTSIMDAKRAEWHAREADRKLVD